MIIISGTLKYDTSRRDEAVAHVTKAIAATRSEDGNVAYRWAFDVEDPATVHVFEAWRDREAIDAHMASPHLAELLVAMGDLGVSDVELLSYEAEEPTRFM